jgi:hypothetical protein
MYEHQIIFKWGKWFILIIIHVLNSQFGCCCKAHHCFAVACSYWPRGHHLHWWGIEPKWLKKHMYEYQLIFKWCS